MLTLNRDLGADRGVLGLVRDMDYSQFKKIRWRRTWTMKSEFEALQGPKVGAIYHIPLQLGIRP